MSAGGTNLEIEVKIRYPAGAADALARIESRGLVLTEPRTLESDTLFDRAGDDLGRQGQLLRLRRAGDRALATYKGPSLGGRYKSREEIEFQISDAAAFVEVLDRLGYHPRFRYEKYRTKFGEPGEAGVVSGIVSIDETPIGVFLELEGKPEWIDRTAARLGLSPSEYLTSSYAALYREYCREHHGVAESMTF